jgi:hypothetical protein
MKRAIALTIAALTTACGGAKLTAEEARNAVSSTSAAQINTPSSSTSQALTVDGSGQALTVDTRQALATQSSFYLLTRGVSLTVNVGVAAWIEILKLIVALPPTQCAANTCTWGPWTSNDPLAPANAHELVVTKIGDGQYDYVFSGAPSGGGFVDVVTGTVFPSGVKDHGHGTFTVNFDNAKLLHPSSNDTGTLEVMHNNVNTLEVDCTFLGATEDNDATHLGQKLNAVYSFVQDANGGDLQVGLHYLNATNDTFTLHSRWNASGVGRCDIAYQAPTQVQLSECWGARTDTPPFDLVTPDQCVFAASPVTITVP